MKIKDSTIQKIVEKSRMSRNLYLTFDKAIPSVRKKILKVLEKVQGKVMIELALGIQCEPVRTTKEISKVLDIPYKVALKRHRAAEKQFIEILRQK